MANSSLDLSDRAVLGPLARLLSAVRRAAGDTPVLLVGAAARDLLLVHAHGVEVQRATEDTDLALAVPTLESLDVILRPELDPDGALRLVAQMPPGDRERQLSLLAAFCAGLFETSLSGS